MGHIRCGIRIETARRAKLGLRRPGEAGTHKPQTIDGASRYGCLLSQARLRYFFALSVGAP